MVPTNQQTELINLNSGLTHVQLAVPTILLLPLPPPPPRQLLPAGSGARQGSHHLQLGFTASRISRHHMPLACSASVLLGILLVVRILMNHSQSHE